MPSFTRNLAFSLAFSVLLSRAQTVLDDGSSAITYSGSWTHDTNDGSTLVDGTQSWTNDPTATLAFSFQGTGFDFCAGLKADRGLFTYTIDGVPAGSGTEQGPGMEVAPKCSVVASIRGLTSGTHQVSIANGGSTYFAADAITYYASDPSSSSSSSATSTSQSSTSSSTSSVTSQSIPITLSPVMPSSSTTVTVQSSRATTTPASSFSMVPLSLLPSTGSGSSSSVAGSTASPSSAQDVAAQHHLSATKKAAMIGGCIAAGFVVACLIALGIYQYFRNEAAKRRSDAIPPSEPSHYLDMGFDWDEKEPLSNAGAVFSEKPSPIGLVRSTAQSNLAAGSAARSNSGRTNVSEPYQPEMLEHPPPIEPYYPSRYSPVQSTHSPKASISTLSNIGQFMNQNSTSFISPVAVNYQPNRESLASNAQTPFAAAKLRTKSSYEGRLAAASASLPDFQGLPNSTPIPRAQPPPAQARLAQPPQSLQYLFPQSAYRQSAASSAYPPTDGNRDTTVFSDAPSPRNSVYSGMELDDATRAVEDQILQRQQRGDQWA